MTIILEQLRTTAASFRNDGDHGTAHLMEEAARVISDGAMWIPVGERLPDGRYTVLVFDPEDGGVQPAEFFAGGEPGGGFYGLGELDGRFSHVTHWMPLPGAPK